MKRTIKLAVVAALALGATSAFATNGSQLIGIGAKSRGMGGVGIATGFGAESGINNPALITTIKGDNEVSFGGTIFMPDIETSNTYQGNKKTAESDSDMFVIPAVSLASKVNDNFYWGIGMWGTGGLGVDYRDTNTVNNGGTHMNMVTALQTMQFGVPLAYTSNGFSLGITPIVQYSSLDIDYTWHQNKGTQAAPNMVEFEKGAGTAQDLAYGINLGMSYEISGLTVGAIYKSKIKFDIDDQLTSALNGMGVGPAQGGAKLDEMATPEEYGAGLSYTTSGHTLAFDWKVIKWEDAEVYKEFGWEDQDVFAVGYQYATDKWALRCGYQYAESAVQDNKGKGLAIDKKHTANMNALGYAGNYSLTNSFNLLGFPGTQETHITFGGSYAFNETISLDLAAVYGLENEEKFKGFTGEDIETSHSEQSYSIQLNYAF